ncbi:MAG: hypothetical protein QOH42_160 [Blastocatellia bacterium]|nr:hypothetical protein [Blastocatellia bacterium]
MAFSKALPATVKNCSSDSVHAIQSVISNRRLLT